MPRANIKEKQDRAVLLSKLPEGTTRIQVETEKGEIKYRAIDELADTDRIRTKDDGTPIVMRSSPGRKRAINLEPANATIKALLRRKEDFVEKDPLRQIVSLDPESPDALKEVMVKITEDAASIEFERREAERTGKETLTLSYRHIQAVRALADTWLKRKEQVAARGIDLEGPAFGAVFDFLLETFNEAMVASKTRPEMIETVFAKFSQMIDDDWKVEAKARMKKLV